MSACDEVEFRIAKLEVRPGDMLVLKCNSYLSQEAAAKVSKALKDKLPEGVCALVLERGCDLAVLSFEEIERRAKLSEAA